MSAHDHILRRIAVRRLGDLAAAIAATVATAAVLGLDGGALAWSAAAWLAFLVFAIGQAIGLYDRDHLRRGSSEIAAALLATCGAAATAAALLWSLDLAAGIPRPALALWPAIAGALACGMRVALRLGEHRRRRLGLDRERLVLAGTADACRAWAAHLSRTEDAEAVVVGMAIDGETEETEKLVRLGGIADLVARVAAERVLVCSLDGAHLVEVADALDATALPISYAPTPPDAAAFLALRTSRLAGRAVVDAWANPLSDGDRLVKRIEDVAVALAAIAVSSPVMIGAAIAIKLTSPGPVLYIQRRHGLHGRPFRVLKFRTMRVADEAKQRQSGAFVQATAGDARITSIGRFLRNSSIDELPQFFNVLAGDMSVVGPRPHPLKLNDDFRDAVDGLMRRHYVKPGITGLAQVSGARGETRTVESMRKRVELDLDYIARWSLLLDLRIIVLTVFKGFINRQP